MANFLKKIGKAVKKGATFVGKAVKKGAKTGFKVVTTLTGAARKALIPIAVGAGAAIGAPAVGQLVGTALDKIPVGDVDAMFSKVKEVGNIDTSKVAKTLEAHGVEAKPNVLNQAIAALSTSTGVKVVDGVSNSSSVSVSSSKQSGVIKVVIAVVVILGLLFGLSKMKN